MNKQQAMTWFDSHFNAGTVTNPALRNIISEMFDSVEPEKFVPTIGRVYQLSNDSYFNDPYVARVIGYMENSAIPFRAHDDGWKYCRPVPEELRTKYGE